MADNEKAKLIKKEYPRYKKWSDNYTLILHEKFLKEYVILEFDNQSVDIHKTLKELNTRFKSEFKLSKIKFEENNVIEIIFDKLNFFNIEKINKFMKSFGWNIALINGEEESNSNFSKQLLKSEIVIQYEARFDEDANLTQDILYHLTPDTRYEKIKRMGLVPKSKSRIATHPERVYLFGDLNDVGWLSADLYDSEPEDAKKYIKKYYLLKIDLATIKDKVKLYKDPNMEDAYYTTNTIPPIYISLIGQHTIQK